jgi:hypothetical protein
MKSKKRIHTVALMDTIPLVSSEAMNDTWQQRARRRMGEVGVTQEDLKKPLGVKTRGAVGHYLSGRRDPSPEQFKALSVALQTSPNWLLAIGEAKAEHSNGETRQINDAELFAMCVDMVRTILAEGGIARTDKAWTELSIYKHALDLYDKSRGAHGRTARELRKKARGIIEVFNSTAARKEH